MSRMKPNSSLQKTSRNYNFITVCSANTVKYINKEIVHQGNRCVGIIDSGSSISPQSLSSYDKRQKWNCANIKKQLLTAKKFSCEEIGKLTL